MESRRDGIKYQDLTEELNLLGTQNPLFAGIAENAFHLTDSGLPDWNEAVADSVTIDGLLRKLLEERAYAMRMPNLVAYLVNNEFSWEKVYEKVLWDIAHPLTPEEAADYLVQQDAVNQASLLVDFLKLESHDLLVEQHHVIQVRELKRELQTLDPKSDVLSPELNEEIERDIELGRWGRLKVTLEAGIDILRAQQREEQDRLNQGISKLISDINTMDMQLFEKVDDIPQDALITVQKALSQARTSLMSRDPELIPVVEDYLDHLRFRLERSSWPLEEVREYSADFIQRLTFHELEETEKYSIEELTRAFEDGRLEELGIMQYQLGGSRAQTRMEVLDYWLRLKNEKGVFSGEYGSHVPDFVRQLNSIFGRMIQMKRVISKGDRPLSSDTPLVYEYWQLMYPKTVELEKYCVLMTLPGGSLTGQDIRLFNEFLADKAFEEYHFVIIFTPGCPTSLTEKIKGSMGGDRLILIDDKLMKNLVLAELQGKKPVDLLRPMMMQSMQDSATIFIVNQSTNEHTGIFVGRGARIRTLASSTENYAVYGGRRIGKSSLLNAVKIQLENNKSTSKTKVVYRSLEGELDYDNQHISKMLAKDIGIYEAMGENGDFKDALSHYLQKNPDEKLVIMIDEIDRYIQENKDRHLMIEALRACSDQYGSRLRVIVSGFMQLYDCLKGKGPYSENSDPWSRMFENMKPLGNLQVHEAEKIVKEGFVSILGWQFENRTIPQLIVERTGGHPAFVQCFCAKLLDYVRSRGRHLIKVADIDAINNEITPGTSYMAYVQATLGANLDDTAQFLLLSMAQMSSESSGFTLSRIKEIASLSPIEIDDNTLERLLEKMTVTSVVEKRSVGVYDFTVKDYPKILVQLSSGDVLKDLERRMIGNTDSEENGR